MKLGIKVLGKVSAAVDGVDVAFGDLKQRTLVGILSFAEGKVVTNDRVAELLWGDSDRSDRRRNQINGYVSNIRGALDAAGSGARAFLRTHNRIGYSLDVHPEDVDYFRFRRLAEEAAAAAGEKNHPEAARLGRLALAEWGGAETAGVRGPRPLQVDDASLDPIIETARQEYQRALLACLTAELRIGRHRELIPELGRLATYDENGRTHEELAVLRMVALHRAARTAEALTVYRQLETALRASGVQPNEGTKTMVRRIRSDDPTLRRGPAATRSEPSSPDPSGPADNTSTRSAPAETQPEPPGQATFSMVVNDHGRGFQAKEMTIHEAEGTENPSMSGHDQDAADS